MALCPCCSGLEEEVCCAPLLAGQPAPTAEALMRSRYTAFVRGNLDYIEKSSAEEALDEFDRLEFQRVLEDTTWLSLKVLRTEGGGAADDKGQVEYAFCCKYGEDEYTQHELGYFSKIDGAWFFVKSEAGPKGEPAKAVQIGRNDPCLCGSGKKYKKCCGG